MPRSAEFIEFCERFRDRLGRDASGAPHLPAQWVAHRVAEVRLVDLRSPTDVEGMAGYIPGSEFVARATPEAFLELERDAPLVLVSSHGFESHALALALEARGFSMVASVDGGVAAYRAFGYVTSHDASALMYHARLPRTPPAAPRQYAEPGKVFGIEDIENHLGNSRQMPWMKTTSILATGSMQCIDGRDRSGIVGCLGGDLGLLLLALSAYEHVSETELDQTTIRRLFGRRLDSFGSFFMHTDSSAEEAFRLSLLAEREARPYARSLQSGAGVRELLRHPPESIRELVFELLSLPQHLGCGHVRNLVLLADSYQLRPALVSHLLRAFFSARFSGLDETLHRVLPGAHSERAVLEVVQEDPIRAWSKMPLVPPDVGGEQLFVLHRDVENYFRNSLVEFVTRQTDLVEPTDLARVQAEAERLAALREALTVRKLAAGLPMFRATFGRRGGITVESLGTVR